MSVSSSVVDVADGAAGVVGLGCAGSATAPGAIATIAAIPKANPANTIRIRRRTITAPFLFGPTFDIRVKASSSNRMPHGELD